MEAPSELELFLNQQSGAGQQTGEGSFTISRREALKKLAGFQLPFTYAWLLKLVQCAVSGGSRSPIQFELTRKEMRFSFQIPEITFDQLENAFYQVEVAHPRGLGHLLTALWAVGVKEGYPFQLTLRGWKDSLIWDGENLHGIPVENSQPHDLLLVSFLNKEAGALEWAKQVASAGHRNAEILTTLKKRCFTCPVPLTVDGRRLDSLYHCPTHGPTTEDHPLALGFPGQSDLPPFTIPPGTFERVPRSQEVQKFWTLTMPAPPDPIRLNELTTRGYFKSARASTCEIAYLLTAHRKFYGREQSQSWGDRDSYSTLYWVRDGVVVDEEQIEDQGNTVSVAVFVSAEGLQSDLTTLFLIRNPEKKRRLGLARKAVFDSLEELESLESSLEDLVEESKSKSKLLAGGLLLLGAAALWAVPVVGVGLIGGGGATLKAAGKKQKKINESLQQAIKKLRLKLLR